MQPKLKVRIASPHRLQRINTPNFATQSQARFIEQNTRRSRKRYPRQSVIKVPLIQIEIPKSKGQQGSIFLTLVEKQQISFKYWLD